MSEPRLSLVDETKIFIACALDKNEHGLADLLKRLLAHVASAPMSRQSMLMLKVMEECDELSHRVSKALRFGVEEIQPGHTQTNRERINDEFTDLLVAMSMAGFGRGNIVTPEQTLVRVDKVERYLQYAQECGTLSRG